MPNNIIETPDAQFFIITPSTNEITSVVAFCGTLEVVTSENKITVCLHAFDCEIHIDIDPRALIFSSTLDVLYHPFQYDPELFTPEQRDWLKERGPSWATIPPWAKETVAETQQQIKYPTLH